MFTKIKNGAPFDIFISADDKHPLLLETIAFKSIIYAYGKISLWKPGYKIKKNTLIFFNENKVFSIANPKLSPYGNASKDVIANIKIKPTKIILGENINHVFKYIYSKNSEIGIIAFSHIIHHSINNIYVWKISQYLYPKIEQRMIILNDKNNLFLTEAFVNHMKEESIKTLIKNYGYKLKYD